MVDLTAPSNRTQLIIERDCHPVLLLCLVLVTILIVLVGWALCALVLSLLVKRICHIFVADCLLWVKLVVLLGASLAWKNLIPNLLFGFENYSLINATILSSLLAWLLLFRAYNMCRHTRNFRHQVIKCTRSLQIRVLWIHKFRRLSCIYQLIVMINNPIILRINLQSPLLCLLLLSHIHRLLMLLIWTRF